MTGEDSLGANIIPTVASVSSTRLVRDFHGVRKLADKGPVLVTAHGKPELILLHPDMRGSPAEAPSEAGDRYNAKLAIVLDSIDASVAILDHDLNIRRLNSSARRALGVGDREVLGVSYETLLDGHADRFLLARLAEARDTRQADSFDLPSRIAPGRTVKVRLRPWPGGVAMISEDVTDRLQVRELSERNKAMRDAIDMADNIGMGVVDSRGIMIEAGACLGEMVGTNRDSLIGARLVSLFDPANRTTVNEAIASQRERVTKLEVRYLAAGVAPKSARLVLSSYWPTPDGPSFGFVLTPHDHSAS